MISLYHGSKDIIESPSFGKGNPHNDYGSAFYCTESPELSKEWACTGNVSGYSNRYRFDDSGLYILDLTSKDLNILHWLTVLLENRTFDTNNEVSLSAKRFLIDNYHIDLSQYDVIKGYRADDSYFSFAQDFINGSISIATLSSAIRLGRLGEQYAIRSERAFDRLVFEGYEIADNSTYHVKRVMRDVKARNDYRGMRPKGYSKGDIMITHLIDGTVSTNDPRLQ